MSALKGDFLGFTYNGVHSSDLGIVRTSNGSRFDENLLPTIQDKTVQVPGGDGEYYFGSYYTKRQFNIPFAFDGLTESQVEFLKMHFGDRKPHPLVFDECPYKTYMAKVTGTATIKHVPFDDGEGGRVYKGEGSIQFTCYQPFAVCDKKYLNLYNELNKSEWALASGLLETKGKYDSFEIDDYEARMDLYNPGVKEADWILDVNIVENRVPSGIIKIGNNNALVFSEAPVKLKHGIADEFVRFDSKTGLVEGWYFNNNNYLKSGNIYNEYITGGDFYKIPITVLRTPQGVKQENNVQLRVSRNFGEYGQFEYSYYYY